MGIGTLILTASPSTHSIHNTRSAPRTVGLRYRPTAASLFSQRNRAFRLSSSILQLSSLARQMPLTAERRTITFSCNERVRVPRSTMRSNRFTVFILEISPELLRAPAAPTALFMPPSRRLTSAYLLMGAAPGRMRGRRASVPGDPGPWNAAMVADPEDPSALYCGTTRVNRSLDGGSTWTPFEVRSYGPGESREEITSIAVSPVDSNRVYALTEHGKAFRSSDRGISWTDISSGLPNRYGTRVAGGPGSADLVYASFGGTGGGHVFRSADSGATWTDISGDLPDISVNALVADPRHPFWLWAATDAGVAWTYDDGSTWEKVEGGLPRAVFLDLSLDPATGRLVAASYGRGLWELAGSANLAYSLNGRFEIQVTWSVPSKNKSGVGVPVSLTPDTSGFWFFDSSNIELVVKVLDGRPVNGHFWVFYGALSNVQYTITVFDTLTGSTKTYTNPSGQLASVADTSAFPPTVDRARRRASRRTRKHFGPRNAVCEELYARVRAS